MAPMNAPKNKKQKTVAIVDESDVEETTPMQYELNVQAAAAKKDDKVPFGEEAHDEQIRLKLNSGGNLATLKGQTEMMKKILRNAANCEVYVEMVMTEGGAYPAPMLVGPKKVLASDSAMALAIGCNAVLKLLQSDPTTYALALRRFQSDVIYANNCGKFVWDRVSAINFKFMLMARYLFDNGAFGMTQFTASKNPDNRKRIANACVALLTERAWVYRGAFKSSTANYKVKYVIPKEVNDMPYAIEWIWRFINLAFFGHGAGAVTFRTDQYPDESEPADIENVGKEVPRAMVAYSATMLEISIMDWSHGKKTPITLHDDTVREIFRWHDENLIESAKTATGTAVLYSWLYKNAKAYKPAKIGKVEGPIQATGKSARIRCTAEEMRARLAALDAE
ncbi:hypothetical protein PENSPDRAFT_687042 [Peniophora sp. CONT]|nr:hypothetical protein PENSPDRAFT_687042 [Peniophora sp. CONT]